MKNESTTTPTPRQLPGLDPDNQAFWTGGARDELLIYRCGNCRRYIHPPLPHCADCGTPDPAPTAMSGRGRVASFTVNYQSWLPGTEERFVFVAIELIEQAELYVFSNIVDCAPDEVHTGMHVAVKFEQHGELYLPLFTPIRDE
jgi:uncharacterized protein